MKKRHRGLVRIKPDLDLAKCHIEKARHNLHAVHDFKVAGYSDWSASAAFYAIYHSLLAIIISKGYESRNQECTFALIYHMIEQAEIDLDKDLLKDIFRMDVEKVHEHPSIIELREANQYGISLSVPDETYERLLNTSKISWIGQVK